jgi:hypothetical protein
MPSAEQLTHLSGLEAHLRAHLRGQDHVLARAAAVFTRGELGLVRGDRPRGAFLAVGPTGTGKTELVLLAARYLFGEGHVRRFDLSEFQRGDAVERLLGADSSDGGAIGRAAVGEFPRVNRSQWAQSLEPLRQMLSAPLSRLVRYRPWLPARLKSVLSRLA